MALYVAALLADLAWPPMFDELGRALADIAWWRWDEGSPEKGWVLRIAAEDRERGWAAAIAATDLIDDDES
jgi:hypothetical protein